MPRLTHTLGALLLFLLAGTAMAQPGPIHAKLPDRLDPRARYVLYLHGRILEDQGPRPTHERWGTYEYRKILETLAAPGHIVISEQRRPGTDMDQYAKHVVDQVETLVAAGVPAEHITVIGFSKGGGIAVRASALLQRDKVGFVFLAACSGGKTGLDVRGRILSVYEASDDAGRSCAQLFAESKGKGKREEVKISTGEEHGAFYRPRKEWTAPVLAWVRQEN